jgi:crossover junction endodeoxyribonuclease RuvC
MRILGIDPGTATTGFGVIDVDSSGNLKIVDFGLISTSKELPHGQRLDHIYKGICQIVEKYSPEEVSIERLFFATNALTAIAVGQAIGVIKLAVHHHQLPIFDYTPMQVKLYVGGSGKADKKVMKETVKKLLKIRGNHVNEIKDGTVRAKKDNKSHFDDAADAVALAVCHVRKTQFPPVHPGKI